MTRRRRELTEGPAKTPTGTEPSPLSACHVAVMQIFVTPPPAMAWQPAANPTTSACADAPTNTRIVRARVSGVGSAAVNVEVPDPLAEFPQITGEINEKRLVWFSTATVPAGFSTRITRSAPVPAAPTTANVDPV